jgi:hypothetical protein
VIGGINKSKCQMLINSIHNKPKGVHCVSVTDPIGCHKFYMETHLQHIEWHWQVGHLVKFVHCNITLASLACHMLQQGTDGAGQQDA